MPKLTTRKALAKPLGEVVFSDGTVVTAQCYKEDVPYKLYNQGILQGAIVRIDSSYDVSFSAFGLVSKICNTSLDNIHKPSALGLSFSELEQLQPQVYELLKKELQICLFAYKGEETINHKPSKPIMIHDIVYEVTEEEFLNLTSDEGLSNLVNVTKKHQLKPDLLVDLISLAYKLRDKNYDYLLMAGKKLSLSFCDEVELLVQALRQLSPT